MIPDFQKRLENARTVRGSNCFGTALYLAGMKDEDTYADPNHVKLIFAELSQEKPLASPEEGALAFLVSHENFLHAGVVLQVEPLRITHRPDTGRELECYVPFEDFVGPYLQGQVDVVYYRAKEI